jgi:hypothetical protein
MNSYIFWDITLCSPLKVNRRFGGTCHLHLQGRRIIRVLLNTCVILVSCMVRSPTWSWSRHVLRNVGWLSKDYTATSHILPLRPVSPGYIQQPQTKIRSTAQDILRTSIRSMGQSLCSCTFFFSNWHSGAWSPTGSTRHVGHQLVYFTYPGWLWGWRIWWNDDWQGKPKYSEKTCPIATLSTTNPKWHDRARTQAAAVGSQRLTAWAMARPVHVLTQQEF